MRYKYIYMVVLLSIIFLGLKFSLSDKKIDENDSDLKEVAEKAYSLYESGRYDEALKEVDKVISKDSKYPFIHKLKTKILIEVGSSDMALNSSLKALRSEHSDVDDYIVVADLYAEKGNYAGAVNILREKIKIMKRVNNVSEGATTRVFYDEVDLYMKLSHIMFKSGDLADSYEVVKEGLSRSNGSLDLFDTAFFIASENSCIECLDALTSGYCVNPIISTSRYCQIKR